MMSTRRILPLLALLAWPTALEAQNEKSIAATLTTSGITLDGRISEEDWGRAQMVDDFVQSEPRENGTPSERTEVRVLYDRDTLYVSAILFDSEPDKIITNELKRDFEDRESDVFIVSLDPKHDHRNGFTLFVNPGSAQKDQQNANDGRDINADWDGVWHVRSAIDDRGWVTEIAIPFKTLSLSSGSEPVMGINFRRRIRRKNEIVNWSPIPRRFRSSRVSVAGHLEGLRDVQAGGSFRVKPYVLQNWNRRDFGAPTDLNHTGDVGLDVKYAVTSGVALDLTVNTDFSQVEVDAEQINLTRFNLFFPEKRDFFLENAGLFQFGDIPTERGGGRGDDTQLFYSRRIGLSTTAGTLPILGGARLSGKAGPYSLAFLNMQQRKMDLFNAQGVRTGTVRANNFTIARLKRDFSTGADIGVMYTGREGSESGDHNRAFGADFNMQFGQRGSLNSFYAVTDTPSLDGDNKQFKISSGYDDGRYEAYALYADIGENFNPEVGFVPRQGVRNFQVDLGTRYRPSGDRLIREYYPHWSGKHWFSQGEGPKLERNDHYSIQFFFKDGTDHHDSVNSYMIRLLAPTRVLGITIPPGEYSGVEYQISQNTNRSKVLSGTGSISFGDFYDGSKTTLNLSGRVMIQPRLSTDFTYQHNDVDIKAGKLTAELYGWRLNYSFSPFMATNSFIQYNTTTKRVLTNLRFTFRHRPLSDISVVYTEDRLSSTATDTARTFIVKYTHMLQF